MKRGKPPSDAATAEVMTAEVTAALLETPALHDFWCYWCDLAAEAPANGPAAGVPRRQALDIARLEDYLDHVTLSEVLDDPAAPDGRDYRYRVFGTGLVQLEGHDFTGDAASQLGDFTRPLVHAQNARVLEEARPIFCGARTPADYPAARWLRLACPLSRDGTAVDQIIALTAGLEFRTLAAPYL